MSRQINAEENRDKVLKDLNRRLFAKFSENYEMWNLAVYKLSTLDVLMSLAEYSASEDTCIPTIFDDSDEKVIFCQFRFLISIFFFIDIKVKFKKKKIRY